MSTQTGGRILVDVENYQEFAWFEKNNHPVVYAVRLHKEFVFILPLWVGL